MAAIADLAARAAEVRANTVSMKSRTAYQVSWTRFISWLAVMKPELVTPAFRAAVETQSTSDLRAAVHAVITADVQRAISPIDFDSLQATDFVAWLLSINKSGGGVLSYSAYNGHRAALFNLIREYKFITSATLQSELIMHFRELKRTVAETVRAAPSVQTGKDPMPFELYSALCESTLQVADKEGVFVRTFLILTWNLMCRSSNTVTVHYKHMEWRGDALREYFAHMKNDQMGERPRDPRHIYASPLRPATCPVLALGIYWATFPFGVTTTNLFPGPAQYDRFWKQLASSLAKVTLKSNLTRLGIDAQNFGTHSIRKGAATFCSSGSTACPSSTAVHLRVGWSLGGVQNTYLRYEAAGDMHVGRTVCGLPQNSELFAILPPRFDRSDAEVDETIEMLFGRVPAELRLVTEFALASVIYHQDFLCQTLPPNHILRSSVLFTSAVLLERLKD